MDEVVLRVTWGERSFSLFIMRSMCTLTKLSLYDVRFTAAEFLGCLEAVSANLVEFHVEGTDGDLIKQKIMNALTYGTPMTLPGHLVRHSCVRSWSAYALEGMYSGMVGRDPRWLGC